MTANPNRLLHALSWNCGSLRNKTSEILEFVGRAKPDFLGLVETRLTQDAFDIRGYVSETRLPAGKSGGIALLVRRGLPYERIDVDAQLALQAVVIRTADGTIFAIVYKPPQTKLTRQSLDYLFDLGPRVIVMGDFNACHNAWGNHYNNAAGRIVYNYILARDVMMNAPGKPTHFPPNGMTPTTIDFAIVKNLQYFTDMTIREDLDSDHSLIGFEFASVAPEEVPRAILDYRKADWDGFRKNLDIKIQLSHLNSIADIDAAVKQLTDAIHYATNATIPTKIITDKTDGINDEILNSIRIRNAVRRRWRSRRLPEDKITYDSWTRKVRWQIREHRNRLWNDKLKSFQKGDRQLWNLLKKFKRAGAMIPALVTDNSISFTDEQKCEVLAEQYAEVHSLSTAPPTLKQHRVRKKVVRYLEGVTGRVGMDFQGSLTSTKEVRAIIAKLSPHKAPGVDGIQNRLLRNLSRKGVVLLVKITNACLIYGYFPAAWKTAVIAPIVKAGKSKNDPQAYRPISLLSTMAKVVEKVVHARVASFTDSNDILIPEQFGYRSGVSTSHQVARIACEAICGFNTGTVTAMVLLDLQRAFDRVWIDGLLYKLIKYGYPGYLVQIISSYLRGRKLQVRVRSALSGTKEIFSGVPQGSILGPLLFNLYVNDIPTLPTTDVALYADDTAVFAGAWCADAAVAKLQIHIMLLERYYATWKMELNASKSEMIIFTRKQGPDSVARVPLRVDGLAVTPLNAVRYLGVLLDRRLRFTQHARGISQRALLKLRSVYPLIARGSELSTTNKLLLYKAAIRPVLTYASPVWAGLSKTETLYLQRMQNKCLRLATGCDRYTRIVDLHDVAEIEMLGERLSRANEKFYSSIDFSDNRALSRLKGMRRRNLGELKHRLPHTNTAFFES